LTPVCGNPSSSHERSLNARVYVYIAINAGCTAYSKVFFHNPPARKTPRPSSVTSIS